MEKEETKKVHAEKQEINDKNQEEVNEEIVEKLDTEQEEATTSKKTSDKKDKGIFKKKEDLEKKKLQEDNKLLNEKLLRISAEMQNMKRRNDEKIANMAKYEGEDLIKKLLPVVDNFERAIGMDDTNLEDEVSKFLSGFKMIYGNLNNILQSYEIMAIDCLNKSFDPTTMEAVLTETVEGVEPGIVIDVMQKGYTYKGKVIRHAMVKVSS